MSNLMEQLKVYGELLEHIEFDVVTIHALADESTLLNQLELSPEQCFLCDLYWVYMNYFIFVSISCSPDEPPFVVYDRKPNDAQGHQFNITIRDCPLTTNTIRRCLAYLSEWIKENINIIGNGEKLSVAKRILVSNNDIAESNSSET